MADSLKNLAVLYREQGRYREAESLFQEALKLYEKILGLDPPYTKVIRGNLQELRDRQNQ
ncbi:MAG: tetratricopeptide repeat protein [Cyanobacteria bacterium P01_G01_bin.38]